MTTAPSVRRRRRGTIAWILLVLASMVLISYGIWHAGWHIWLPRSTEQEKVWIGNRYILAGSALSIAAAVVTFPLALAGVAEVIRVRGRRQGTER